MKPDRWLETVRADLQSGARVRPWIGPVWRCHSRAYPAESASGSLLATGRFNRAKDKFPEDETWPVLYAGCTEAIALAEVIRNAGQTMLERLPLLCVSRLDVLLTSVYYAYDPEMDPPNDVRGLDYAAECRGFDYTNTHAFAWLARDYVEAMLVPSCTGFREGNLIIFPDRLHASSGISVSQTVTLQLDKS